MQLFINAERVKQIAKSLKEDIEGSGGNIGFSHCAWLQVVSTNLTGKSYETIKALSKSVPPMAEETKQGRVLLATYGDEWLLFVNGRFISCTWEGTDMEVPCKHLASEAHNLAKANNTDVLFVTLPQILSSMDEGNTDSMIGLAEKMGYLRDHPSIFELFDDNGAVVFIQDEHCDCRLNDDAWGELETVADSHTNNGVVDQKEVDETCIWTPETNGGERECFFTFGSLCQATTQDGGKNWHIPDPFDTNHPGYIVSFKR